MLKINKEIKVLLTKLSTKHKCTFKLILTFNYNDGVELESITLSCTKLNVLFSNSGETNRNFESIDELTKYLNYLIEKL